MTVRELINKLLDKPMGAEVVLAIDGEFTNAEGQGINGYEFNIDDVERFNDQNVHITFTDWRQHDDEQYEQTDGD